MDSGFPQPDVDLTPDMVAGAALLAPSFCEDLSTWRMTIARDGTVVQELRPTHLIGNRADTVCIHLQSFVTRERISQIEALAAEIGFRSFQSEYLAEADDLQYTSITLNLDGETKRVMVYGPHMLAYGIHALWGMDGPPYEGDPDMIGYVRLWDLMREISPYRETTVTYRARKEAGKGWWARLFGRQY